MIDATVDQIIRQAIREHQQLRFQYDGLVRLGEPHDYGMHNGVMRLLVYQTAGQSRSGKGLGWRLLDLKKTSGLELTDLTFPGPRDVPTGQHLQWDRLYASVSRQEG